MGSKEERLKLGLRTMLSLPKEPSGTLKMYLTAMDGPSSFFFFFSSFQSEFLEMLWQADLEF